MSADIVNLRRWRKERARDDRRRAADANAARHGIPKAVTDLETARDVRAQKHHDGHKLDDSSES